MDSGDFENPKGLGNILKFGEAMPASYGPLTLNLTHRIVKNEQGDSEDLTSMEFQILWLLVRARGVSLTLSQIEDFVYDEKYKDKDIPLSNSVNTVISRIRNKLRKLFGDRVKIANLNGYSAYQLELS